MKLGDTGLFWASLGLRLGGGDGCAGEGGACLGVVGSVGVDSAGVAGDEGGDRGPPLVHATLSPFCDPVPSLAAWRF